MKDSGRADVVALHDEFFNVLAEAFPDLVDLHYGLGSEASRKGGLLAALGRVRAGQRLLLDRVVDVAGLASLARGSRGLDVGCGLAGTSAYLHGRFGFVMTGLNINPGQARMAKTRLAGLRPPSPVTVVQGDGRALPFRSASFDFLVAIEVAFHVREKDALLSEAARVLKPGGRLVLVDQEWAEALQVFDLMFYPAGGTYRRLARGAGLDVVSEVDLSAEVAPWMEDYADVAGPWASLLATASLALRGRPLLAWRFARGLSWFNRLILEDIRSRGVDVSDVGRWSAIRRLRRHLADRLRNGEARHEVFVLGRPERARA